MSGLAVSSPLAEEHTSAERIASEAGQRLTKLRSGAQSEQGLGAKGDRLSHEFIVRTISEHYPNDAILSEEAADDRARLQSERVWIVDPLDGTREYGEPERVDWAVHVCLAVEGRAVVGAVALPARNLTLSTGHAVRTPQKYVGRPRIVVSRTRPPVVAELLAQRLEGDLLPMGSAGAKAMSVVLGEADIYVHAGGQYEWDSAAPVAVAVHAGLHASRIDGSSLVYNQPDPWLPDLLICRKELAQQTLFELQNMATVRATQQVRW